jgi:hypothetical protein
MGKMYNKYKILDGKEGKRPLGSGAHPASYPMSPRSYYRGFKSHNSPLSSSEFKNEWSVLPFPHYVFRAW